MKITVIGTGYVGLVSGVCFSEFGFNITCVDKNAEKIAKLNQGVMPIYEPGLEQMVENNVKAGRLKFTTDFAKSVSEADVLFIAVGTPQNDTDGMPDLTALNACVDELSGALQGHTLIVIKSTVPVGTNRRVMERIAKQNPTAEFDIASNPEFLREGSAIKDFMVPDRVVVGVNSKRAQDILTKLYNPILLNGAKFLATTFESAEMIKYAANSMLAVRIAFINEIADLCEKTGANVIDVSKGIGMDQRIGSKFLQAGPGYGGSCFPKDTMALRQIARGTDCEIKLLEATISSNLERKGRMVTKIEKTINGGLKGKTIAVLGLTFKPDTDDIRESVSLVIVPELLKKGASIRTYDPQGMQEAKNILTGNIAWCDNAYDAMQGADALVILTEWNEFRSLDLQKIKSLLKTPMIIDLRNIYKRADMVQHGFHYASLGRKDVIPGQPNLEDMRPADEAA